MPDPRGTSEQYELYRVAIICTISFEMNAVRLMLDSEHPPLPAAHGDSNLYVLGELSGHNVILASFGGRQGKGASATVATNIACTFPYIEWRFLVGIGGGVPSHDHDIRLGDVVISMPEGQHGGIAQFNLGKDTDDGLQLKGFLLPPPTVLTKAVELMRFDHMVADSKVEAYLSQILQKGKRRRLSEYRRPLPEQDILFDENCPHVATSAECKDCDRTKIRSRPLRAFEGPEIHYGLIASGDRVMRSAAKRIATIGNTGDILCLETEAAGIATEFPCLVIRGVSDYADSHKNDSWQYYAAAAAAASTKELLSYVNPEQLSDDAIATPLSPRRNETISQRISGQGIQNSGSFSVRGNVNIGISPDAEQKAATEKCLAALCRTNPRHDMERIQSAKGGLLEASYKWILHNQSFRAWCEDQAQLLWVKGNPGKGKTMLLCGIIRELELSSASTVLISYFFCEGTDAHVNNATAVLRGLIYLLLKQQPSLISHVQEYYDPSGNPLFREANSWVVLSGILSSILCDSGLTDVRLILDALDECETGLPQLLHFISQHSSGLPNVRWIVSSRNRLDIDQQLKLPASGVISLELPKNAAEISRAVDTYIDARMSELDFQDDHKAPVREIMRQKANGTFLWAALVIKELKGAQRWEILQVVEEVPADLEMLYDRMTMQIQQLTRDKPKFCRLTLSAAALALRPLHLTELGVISGLPDVVASNRENIRDIVALCGSFLTLQNDYVYLIHQSVRDYLVGKDGSSANSIIFASSPSHLHHSIFLRSLQALESLRKNIYNLDNPGVLVDEIKVPDPDPLAAICYPCVYWIDHFCKALNSPECATECLRDISDDGSILDFFKKRFLYWLESLSLIGGLFDCVPLIRRLMHIAQSQPDTSPCLFELLQDAERFVLSHIATIEVAPLQTYGSALAFSPSLSKVRTIYWEDEKLPFIETVVGMKGSWGAHQQTLDHDYMVTALAFSPDGEMLVSTSHGTIYLWDATTGFLEETLWEPRRDELTFDAVAFSADGKTIVSTSNGGAICLWDTEKGTCRQTHEECDDKIHAIALSPEGKTLVESGSGPAGDGNVCLWDTTTGMLQRRLDAGSKKVTALAFSSYGRMVASGDNDGNVYLWDMATGVLQQKLQGHDKDVKHLALTPGGNMLASASYDNTICLWDTTGVLRRKFEWDSEWLSAFALSPDGEVVVWASDSGTIHLYDTIRELRQSLREHGNSIMAVAFSPDGKTLATASGDYTIGLWDMASVWYDDTVRGWDLATNGYRPTHGHSNEVNFVALSPDTKTLATASADGTVCLWDAARGKYQGTLRHGDIVDAVAWSPDNKTLASGSTNGTICLWDLTTGTLYQTLHTTFDNIDHIHSGVRDIAFSPDSKRLALASRYTRTIYLWDTAECTPWKTLEVDDGIDTLAFSPDGKGLVSASTNWVIRLWDVETGATVQRILEPPSYWVGTISLSLDGTHLETDRESISIDWNSETLNTSRDWKPLNRLSILDEGTWIVKDGKRLVLLPDKYGPPWGKCVAVKDGMVVVAGRTGRVTFLYFATSALSRMSG